jgi:glycosyltransferase involved in cell wall biosynthesis
MPKVLHITPHLGGGVGKALSGLIEQVKCSPNNFIHKIVCLEKPEKSQFIEKIIDYGCKIVYCPNHNELCQEIAESDIVQIEFWNHPILLNALCSDRVPPMRLLIWYHNSGLFYPQIPLPLISLAQRFVFTSECSFLAPNIKHCSDDIRQKLTVISSGGGLENLPLASACQPTKSLQSGYFGSLNFSKLHPEFISFLGAVKLPNFSVRLIGDETNKTQLINQCLQINRPNLLEFRGYTENIETELFQINVLIYLLNPSHYGTAENALIEAMAMGIVPIVLNNPAEQCIVQDQVTGFIVKNAEQLAEVIHNLAENPSLRFAISQRCSTQVKQKYQYEKSYRLFCENYQNLLNNAKRTVDFQSVFGCQPSDWFRVFYDRAKIFQDDGNVILPEQYSCYSLFEKTKGSVFHFSHYYPDDLLLQKWLTNLNNLSSLLN